jgi:tRNA (guanine-N7-)-methyltransferase
MTQRVLENSSVFFLREEQLAAAENLAHCFAQAGPLALEIGCGIGDFMVQLAAAQPQTNFLAIDIYNKGCIKTCRRLEAEGLENVRVARIEARHLLLNYCAAESLSAIYINCPDPWPKKRHRDRRLVNHEFLDLARYALAPAGSLYFSTDFADYAEQVADTLAERDDFANQLPSPIALELPGYPISKYMRRFLDLGQPIHYFHYRRGAAAAALPRPAALQPGFRTRERMASND